MDTPIILYNNLLLNATLSSSPVAETGYDVRNIIDNKSFTYFKFSGTGVGYITADLGSAQTANAFAIMGHNFADMGASVSLESSPDGITWAVREPAFTPTDNKALLKLFVSYSARYWRVKIYATGTKAFCAVIFLGQIIRFPDPPDVPYSSALEEIESDSARSKAGFLLGVNIKYKRLKISPIFSHILKSWVDSDFVPFWDNYASDLKPFFYQYGTDTFWVAMEEGSSLSLPRQIAGYYQTLAFNLIAIKD